ncbi:hypothetical protein RJ55_03860 [Drechmeria coniospora]|nr:hypothetical protein RJ55_03860 [Drechmeria coniospora]
MAAANNLGLQVENTSLSGTDMFTIQLEEITQTVTVTKGMTGETPRYSDPGVAINTADLESEGPTTVTVQARPLHKIVTITVRGSPSDYPVPASPTAFYTAPEIAKAYIPFNQSQTDDGEMVVTRTITDTADMSDEAYLQDATAAPEAQDYVQNAGGYRTVSTTTGGSDGSAPMYVPPLYTAPCPYRMNSTSIATVYNTVRVTLDRGRTGNATSATLASSASSATSATSGTAGSAVMTITSDASTTSATTDPTGTGSSGMRKRTPRAPLALRRSW